MTRSPIPIIVLLLVCALSGACLPDLLSQSASRFVDCDDIETPADMRCIPGAAFTRGSERASRQEDTGRTVRDESPVAVVEISTFLMDTYEVTFGDYQKCLQAGGCDQAGPRYRGYSNPKQPMLGASWFAARKYCRWAGKRLPTEAEWERAARGPDGERYPWGNETATCERAIIQENGKKGCGTGRTHDVGTRPVERYGLYDMGGNSWEWVNDWYAKDYAACGDKCKGRDPLGPCDGADKCPGHNMRIVRGGSWWWNAEQS